MKLTKLSLIAAVAVAGLTSANAKPLEEAIKNVDVSGSVVYRYNDYAKNKANAAGSTTNNYYKITTDVKAKATDDITLNTRFTIGENGTTNEVGLDAQNKADGNVDVQLSEVNFNYSGIENASITVGKQGVATPFTVSRDSLGNESTGTGILATYSLAPVTIAGAYFNQTNITHNIAKTDTDVKLEGTDIYTVGLLGSFAGIDADAWYIDVKDTASAYTAGLAASFDVAGVKLAPSVRYSELEYDASKSDEVDSLKVELSAEMGMFNAYLAYGETGKDGAVALDGNGSDTVLDPHWRATLDMADAEAMYAAIGANLTDKISVALKYSDLDVNKVDAGDTEETYVQAKYNVSSDLYTYVRVGTVKLNNDESSEMGRLHVEYSF